ncbi:MAG: cytochrome c [Candidatus Binataceae bacterium]|nr:cytochrome c [Candidatus Binataceae bacterium]
MIATGVFAGEHPPLSHDKFSAPAQLYVMNCWGCHQPHGEGIAGAVPRLKDTVGYFLQVPGGREYLIEVPGVAGSSLSNAQVAQVMNWMLSAFSSDQLPTDFKPYTEAEVAKYRPHQLNNIGVVRARLASQLAAQGIKIPSD